MPNSNLEGETPENREILSTWRVVLAVGIFATIVGLPSDLENIPANLHTIAIVSRLSFLICFALLLIVSWSFPPAIFRYHTILAIASIGSVYIYLTWLDASSGDITRSGYHRSMVLPSIALMVSRRMSLWIQTLALIFAVVYYGVVIGMTYELSVFGETVRDKNYRDIMMDMTQIHVILLLVFQRYRNYHVEELRLRQLLKRANDAKSEIIAKVNHELQVPVLGILANLDTIENKLKPGESPDPLRRIIGRTQNYCLYQRTLINNMIFASSAASQDPFFVDREDSAGLVDCYAKSSELVEDIHDGQIVGENPPDVYVACQKEILMIILINILSNCAEHSSSVRIAWDVQDMTVRMRTENDLVTPLNIDAIFDKWTTSRQDKTKPILGLGLNIARDLIEKLGGDITAREEANIFYLAIVMPLRT